MAKVIQGSVTIELDTYEMGIIRRAIQFGISEDAWSTHEEDIRAEELLKALNGE